ncbi:hypothetical protein IL306_006235 [Fusarium sp. DS 682]|nr:hypothetical protein IL306_006235 [Fusarium sp. DS 682]
MSKGKIGFSMPDLIGQADKLSIDDLNTSKEASNISRYQQYPYARFNPDKTQVDALDKTSPEYHERIRKVINVLEEFYLEVHEEYQNRKNDIILEIEHEDQLRWNRFILNPTKYMPLDRTKLQGLERFDDVEKPVFRNPSFLSRGIYDQQRDLAILKELIETGQRELARLEGSDSFIHLRNEFVNKHEEAADNCDVYSIHGESTCSSCSNRDIYD